MSAFSSKNERTFTVKSINGNEFSALIHSHTKIGSSDQTCECPHELSLYDKSGKKIYTAIIGENAGEYLKDKFFVDIDNFLIDAAQRFVDKKTD